MPLLGGHRGGRDQCVERFRIDERGDVLALGLDQGEIGAAEKDVPGDAGRCDGDARGEARLRPVRIQLGRACLDVAHEKEGLLDARTRQHGEELVATDAVNGVARADRLLQRNRYSLD